MLPEIGAVLAQGVSSSGTASKEGNKYCAMDAITYAQIQQLLDGGISLLSPIQRSIVTRFYLFDKPATQKHFLSEHAISKPNLDVERGAALSSLHSWLRSHGLSGMGDIE
jgi:hypothetical protein